MKEFFENRNGHKVRCYIITITDEMKILALDFANKIILTENQYSRMLPQNMRETNNLNLEQ